MAAPPTTATTRVQALARRQAQWSLDRPLVSPRWPSPASGNWAEGERGRGEGEAFMFWPVMGGCVGDMRKGETGLGGSEVSRVDEGEDGGATCFYFGSAVLSFYPANV